MKVTPRIIVHGGAWSIPQALHEDHVKGCYLAVARVLSELKAGMPAIVAVEKAVNVLEEDPTFDAGHGAFLNARGEIELDAIICDGRNLDFGAIAAVQNLLHPISAARLIMEKSEHSMLVAAGAQQYLAQMDFASVAPEELLTEREMAFYKEIRKNPDFKTRHPFEPHPSDTVGAVVLDVHGNLAAGTSTGGTPRKLPGRVGDSPIIGAGAYADNKKGACSTTGYGESIMKVQLARTVCDLFLNTSPEKAVQSAISDMQERVSGLGGAIGITPGGDYAFHHNTDFMAFAYLQENGEIFSNIKVN